MTHKSNPHLAEALEALTAYKFKSSSIASLGSEYDPSFKELNDKISLNCNCKNNKHWTPEWHTSDCWRNQRAIAALGQAKPEVVGMQDRDEDKFLFNVDRLNVYAREIWNAAIEAAANKCANRGCDCSEFVEELKK